MATIQESNVRALNVLRDESHFVKAMADNKIRHLLYKQFGFDVWGLPVCERCEGYAFWDKSGTGTCTGCGHTTKTPLTVEQFYEEGYHVDRTVRPGAAHILDRERVNGKELCTVYAGDADIGNDPHKKIIIARS